MHTDVRYLELYFSERILEHDSDFICQQLIWYLESEQVVKKSNGEPIELISDP